jgi:hypothetical protein
MPSRMPAIVSEAALRWHISEQQQTITRWKGEKGEVGSAAVMKTVAVSGETPFHSGALPCRNKECAKDS